MMILFLLFIFGYILHREWKLLESICSAWRTLTHLLLCSSLCNRLIFFFFFLCCCLSFLLVAWLGTDTRWVRKMFVGGSARPSPRAVTWTRRARTATASVCRASHKSTDIPLVIATMFKIQCGEIRSLPTDDYCSPFTMTVTRQFTAPPLNFNWQFVYFYCFYFSKNRN